MAAQWVEQKVVARVDASAASKDDSLAALLVALMVAEMVETTAASSVDATVAL